jgi:hypothetical protein
MNELQLLKEQWSEQMFEARANGIQTESFEDWNHKRMIRMEFFNEWKNAESDPESIAEALAS